METDSLLTGTENGASGDYGSGSGSRRTDSVGRELCTVGGNAGELGRWCIQGSAIWRGKFADERNDTEN